MKSNALVPVEEYLRTTYKPACDFLDGILRQKSLPAYKHGKMQFRVLTLISQAGLAFEATPEQTVRVSAKKFLVPDVAVQRTSELQQPYPEKPIHLCVEILSPEDRFSLMTEKCETYHDWGVRHCWIVDPDNKECWEYQAGDRPHRIADDGSLQAGEISIAVADVFAGF